MEAYKFSKMHTSIAKGIAIILMLLHHLFRFPERIQEVTYIPLISINNFPFIEFLLGDFGKICVAMFVFLSGYGLYEIFKKNIKFSIKDSIDRVFKLLINYWIVFFIFVPIGLIFYGQSPEFSFSIKSFIKNLLVVSSNYNSAWWFLKLYIELLILFPLINYSIISKNFKKALLISIILYFSSCIFQIIPSSIKIFSIIKEQIVNLLFWQFVFCIGCFTSKYRLFSKINNWIFNLKLNKNGIYFLIIFTIFLLRNFLSFIFIKITGKENYLSVFPIFDVVFAPLFVLFITNLFYSGNKTLELLGRHSTNIWLTHCFFCYSYFQSLVFFPRFSILILVWLIILSLATSLLINKLIEIINKGMEALKDARQISINSNGDI